MLWLLSKHVFYRYDLVFYLFALLPNQISTNSVSKAQHKRSSDIERLSTSSSIEQSKAASSMSINPNLMTSLSAWEEFILTKPPIYAAGNDDDDDADDYADDDNVSAAWERTSLRWLIISLAAKKFQVTFTTMGIKSSSSLSNLGVESHNPLERCNKPNIFWPS